MNIHEYQAKQLLAKYGVAVPKGGVAYTTQEAEGVAKELKVRIGYVCFVCECDNSFIEFVPADLDPAVNVAHE